MVPLPIVIMQKALNSDSNLPNEHPALLAKHRAR